MRWRTPLLATLLALAALAGIAAADPATPPPEAAIPAGPDGAAIRRGLDIITNTRAAAPEFAGNDLRCANCHLDAGRTAGAAPLWAAFGNFPVWRDKNRQINSFEKRVQDCFIYSINGKPPPLGGEVLLAVSAYAGWLAQGQRIGVSPPGRGFPAIAAPPLPPDDGRGAVAFAEHCAACHGPDGQGLKDGSTVVNPPLWGPASYNWGAGMAQVDKAAAFIRANMPLGNGNSLSVQQAWDIAWFIDGQTRPQDPRFAGNLAATRAEHHNRKWSRYGTRVAGRLRGDPASTPPHHVPPGHMF
ncbi:MAG: c-type cytochrome [Alphaproteobacteria bacterium]|nr:c-type cytochrome [Alphaproteobacteria bacterium]